MRTIWLSKEHKVLLSHPYLSKLLRAIDRICDCERCFSRKVLPAILKNSLTIFGTIIMNNLIDYNYLVSYHLIVVKAVD